MVTAPRRASLVGLAALSLAVSGCRDAKQQSNIVALLPSGLAAGGCTGPDQAFSPPQGSSVVPIAAGLDALSQLTAAGDAETLYLTAGDEVVELDVSSAVAVETTLVSSGTVGALLAAAGFGGTPRLSGLGVLDAGTLLVMEHGSNSVLAVDRTAPDTVILFAGEPNVAGGFADGAALPGAGLPPARFSFGPAAGLVATDPLDGRVFVADSGNHAIRQIADGFVSTLAGTGAAFFSDGSLQESTFDTPAGLTLSCSGTLLVTETGAAGAGGQRLRRLVLGQPSFFGQQGTVVTVAGDGTAATIQGDGGLAQLFAPRSPLATSENDTYWIDSGSGILRRLSGPADTVDCPLWSDCAAAVAGGGDFTPAAVTSLTQTPAGVLFVLDAGAGELRRVTP